MAVDQCFIIRVYDSKTNEQIGERIESLEKKDSNSNLISIFFLLPFSKNIENIFFEFEAEKKK